MSRIGHKAILVPDNVKVRLAEGCIFVEGPKGKTEYALSDRIPVEMKDKKIIFKRVSDTKKDKSLHGTYRSLVQNMIQGVTQGFIKELEIEGIGFRAQLQDQVLSMQLGFTHPVQLKIPAGLVIKVPKPTSISVEGIDKGKVGHFASIIHKQFEAEPYKGKGIRYAGELVRRKAGKTVTK